MITDDQRRDVARRLRKAIGLTEFAEVLGFNWTDDSDWTWKDVSNLVADLIEPSEPEVRCVAEVKVDGERLEQLVHDAAVELTGIDRDALLELAEELEKCAWYFGLDFDEDEPLRDRLEEASEAFAGIASRIREALGADDA